MDSIARDAWPADPVAGHPREARGAQTADSAWGECGLRWQVWWSRAWALARRERRQCGAMVAMLASDRRGLRPAATMTAMVVVVTSAVSSIAWALAAVKSAPSLANGSLITATETPTIRDLGQ